MKMEDNIRMDLRERGWEGVAWRCTWYMIRTSCELLWTR